MEGKERTKGTFDNILNKFMSYFILNKWALTMLMELEYIK